MKHRIILTAMLATALSLLSGCNKTNPDDITPTDTIHVNNTLTATSWEGTYNSPITAPDGGTITFTLTWTVDFLTDSTGTLLCEVASPVSQPQYRDIEFQYTVQGTTGHMYAGGADDTFLIDWSNNIISMDMQMPIDLGSGTQLIGGPTNLHRIK